MPERSQPRFTSDNSTAGRSIVEKPPFSTARFARRFIVWIALDLLVFGTGILGYLMIMMSGLAFAEKVVMGYQLEMWHALVFGAGYAFIAIILANADVKTPLALIARFAAMIVSGMTSVFLPAIIAMLSILWFMAIPSHGFMNLGNGAILWFLLIASPAFAAGGADI